MKLEAQENLNLTQKDHEKLPLFSFSSLEAATDYFADDNKLGEGCYRPVYKVNDSVFYLPNDGMPSLVMHSRDKSFGI